MFMLLEVGTEICRCIYGETETFVVTEIREKPAVKPGTVLRSVFAQNTLRPTHRLCIHKSDAEIYWRKDHEEEDRVVKPVPVQESKIETPEPSTDGEFIVL